VDVPHEVEELQDKNVIKICAKGDVSAALTESGDIYFWGKTKGGALGSAFSTNLTVPKRIEFENLKFKELALGTTHFAAITEDGKVVTAGNPFKGKLGQQVQVNQPKSNRAYKQTTLYGEKSKQMNFAIGLDGIEFIKVACGTEHTVALSKNGDVYTWGWGREGALGHGDFNQVDIPKKVAGLSNIVEISAGADFTVCKDAEGVIHSFGANKYG
jgi:alpha-tubulin suppressor-like RCC1 family protein